jgi:primosomal protein N' (replication factor Y) (superfamily II helicase)
LIIAPDEKDVDLIIDALVMRDIDALKITAAMPREERYRNFLLAIHGKKRVVVGTRSAVFVPMSEFINFDHS